MTQAELNRRYKKRINKNRIGIHVKIPDDIKKIKMLETIADNYKRDNF